MINWLKLLWKSKISVTIVTPAVDISRVVDEYTIIHNDAPSIRKKTQTHYRFVCVNEVDATGNQKRHWCTEEYKRGKWWYVNDTLSHNKNQAMALHQELINCGIKKPVKTTTVLWEGLSAEETASWIALQAEEKI